jgi:hypothetical protein
MKRKKLWIIIGVVFLLLIITNPSQSDFKNFLELECKCEVGKTYEHPDGRSYGRTFYLGIFSIYKDYGVSDSRYDTYYLGVFKNFVKIKEE